MENWTNLNKVLVLERGDFTKKEQESQTLVGLCMSGVTREFKDIKNILKNGAHINCFADMATPLIAAIRTDNVALGRFLLKMGASISYKPSGLNDDAFWEALKSKQHDFLELFISNKCILNRDADGKTTPLIYATLQSDVNAVEILLGHPRIKVNERDSEGNTALHYNVSMDPQSEEDTRIGKLLVAAGADINGRNFAGQTPEDRAIDATARAMLLSSKLERDLPVKEVEPEISPELQPDLAAKKTKTNRLKI